MKYDDASWHYGGKFPGDLRPIAGATHTGMFFAWALLSGFGSSFHLEDFPQGIAQLETREITPGAYFFKFLDGKFVDSDLNEEGNAFTVSYFNFETGKFLVITCRFLVLIFLSFTMSQTHGRTLIS